MAIFQWEGTTPATSAPALGSPLPHLHRDRGSPLRHICTGTGAFHWQVSDCANPPAALHGPLSRTACARRRSDVLRCVGGGRRRRADARRGRDGHAGAHAARWDRCALLRARVRSASVPRCIGRVKCVASVARMEHGTCCRVCAAWCMLYAAVACCMLHVACCISHVVFSMLHVACCI